jgi:hypothetical protein
MQNNAWPLLILWVKWMLLGESNSIAGGSGGGGQASTCRVLQYSELTLLHCLRVTSVAYRDDS